MEITHFSLFLILCFGAHRTSSETLLRQKRNWIIDSFSIDEGYEGDFPYSLGTIKLEEDFGVFEIYGQGVDKEPRGILKIDANTGEVTVHGRVDYEQFQVIKLTFLAMNKGNHTVNTRLGIHIRILDANDHAPQFEQQLYVISVKESSLQGNDLINIKAVDKDISEKYRQFDFRIVSVTPQVQGYEFYLTRMSATDIGTISFKGCLDHEKAEKHIIIVEAKDRGKPKQLSSSCTIVITIEDGNNHLPVFTRQRVISRVKEGQEDVLILREPVTDEDTKGTDAWRAKYKIQGDKNNHFRITTDPETNEALLYVDKQLNYEDNRMKNITITVENEAPYYSCKVLEKTPTGLWKVDAIGDKASAATGLKPQPLLSRQNVTVIVEDENEAPVFDVSDKTVWVSENVQVGKYLATFLATDPDIRSSNTIEYRKGKDPAKWVTVDPENGRVTTSKIIDRESSFVNDSTYVVTIHAADNGKPAKTSTATLTIKISDVNDNAPFLVANEIDICQSSKSSLASITASDLDKDPNGGPFQYKLHGDVKGKWRVYPEYGYSVNLVKENTVHSGLHDLSLEVTDLQGNAAVHNLSVTVCECSDITRPNCRFRKASSTSVGGGTVGIILFSMLLLAGLLLLVILISCKKEKIPFTDDGTGHLMISNTERPGTDCTVAFDPLSRHPDREQSQKTSQTAMVKPMNVSLLQSASTEYTLSKQQSNNLQWLITNTENEAHTESSQYQRERSAFSRGNSLCTSSSMGKRYQRRTSYGDSRVYSQQTQEALLKKMLHNLQDPGKELGDYAPHPYAEEGDSQHSFNLDAISISEDSFDPDLYVDFRFSELASVCMPTDSTAYSMKF